MSKVQFRPLNLVSNRKSQALGFPYTLYRLHRPGTSARVGWVTSSAPTGSSSLRVPPLASTGSPHWTSLSAPRLFLDELVISSAVSAPSIHAFQFSSFFFIENHRQVDLKLHKYTSHSLHFLINPYSEIVLFLIDYYPCRQLFWVYFFFKCRITTNFLCQMVLVKLCYNYTIDSCELYVTKTYVIIWFRVIIQFILLL